MPVEHALQHSMRRVRAIAMYESHSGVRWTIKLEGLTIHPHTNKYPLVSKILANEIKECCEQCGVTSYLVLSQREISFYDHGDATLVYLALT